MLKKTGRKSLSMKEIQQRKTTYKGALFFRSAVYVLALTTPLFQLIH
ncbi:hypothetical protein SD78_0944 [Bacillus badius]|nr:hypothetical protein SD78_0944 [Bacillus badius]